MVFCQAALAIGLLGVLGGLPKGTACKAGPSASGVRGFGSFGFWGWAAGSGLAMTGLPKGTVHRAGPSRRIDQSVGSTSQARAPDDNHALNGTISITHLFIAPVFHSSFEAYLSHAN